MCPRNNHVLMFVFLFRTTKQRYGNSYWKLFFGFTQKSFHIVVKHLCVLNDCENHLYSIFAFPSSNYVANKEKLCGTKLKTHKFGVSKKRNFILKEYVLHFDLVIACIGCRLIKFMGHFQ